jgi:hypothetical protein
MFCTTLAVTSVTDDILGTIRSNSEGRAVRLAEHKVEDSVCLGHLPDLDMPWATLRSGNRGPSRIEPFFETLLCGANRPLIHLAQRRSVAVTLLRPSIFRDVIERDPMLHTVIVLDNNLTVGLLPPAVKCPIHKIPLVCPACLGSATGRRKTQAARKNGVLGAGRWGVKSAGRASLKRKHAARCWTHRHGANQ